MAWADSPPDYTGEWGGFGCCGLDAPDGTLYGPWAVAVAPDGTVYVCDSINDRVEHFTADGVFLGKWGGLDDPRGIAVAPDSTVYVTDSLHDRVVHYSADGTYLDEFGSSGTGPGEFDFPWGVAVGPNGEIYVADNCNDRVQRFTADHTFVREWGGTGSGEGQLNCPSGVAVNDRGQVYVVDSCNSRVQRFNDAGEFQLAWGSFGSEPGRFNSVRGVAVDINGAVYVADSGNHRIQKFTRDGVFLSEWSTTSPGDTLDRPGDVAVGSGPGFGIYVVDVDNYHVFRYQYPVTGIGDGPAAVASRVRIFPNPVLSRADIRFTLDFGDQGGTTAGVRAEIYDLAGRRVRLLEQQGLEAGPHTLTWDGSDESGRPARAGVYFVRVLAGNKRVGTARIVRLP